MKGYRKISEGSIHCSTEWAKCESNYALDDEIRTNVHSPILGENEKSGCEEYYVVIYKKQVRP
jgi:hypothetical protein